MLKILQFTMTFCNLFTFCILLSPLTRKIVKITNRQRYHCNLTRKTALEKVYNDIIGTFVFRLNATYLSVPLKLHGSDKLIAFSDHESQEVSRLTGLPFWYFQVGTFGKFPE